MKVGSCARAADGDMKSIILLCRSSSSLSPAALMACMVSLAA